MNISLPSALLSGAVTSPIGAGSTAASGFSDAITAAINSVENTQSQADAAAKDLLINGKGDVHTVALAAQSAELSLELFQQVRNKFVSAYQEIMRMPM